MNARSPWAALLGTLPIGSAALTALVAWTFVASAEEGLFPSWYSVAFPALAEGVLMFLSTLAALVVDAATRGERPPILRAATMAVVAAIVATLGFGFASGGTGQSPLIYGFVAVANGVAVGLVALPWLSRSSRRADSSTR